jgi:RluA family pseudouridine synthase
VSKPKDIELTDGSLLQILYEDRAVLAIDKPAGWMLVPFNWQRTRWNLQAAIESSISAGAYWAVSRQLRFLRNVHRLDAETSGILLFGKSRGAVETLGDLFESRGVEKTYLAVVSGIPRQPVWECRLKLGPDPASIGRVRVDEQTGKDAETSFRLLGSRKDILLGQLSLVEARPVTGRTHQIRVHLAATGCPVAGDPLYGLPAAQGTQPMGLRAVRLSYRCPFTRRPVSIRAPVEEFLREYGFAKSLLSPTAKPEVPQGPAPRSTRGSAVRPGHRESAGASGAVTP